jgi:hypothetical protein
MTLYRITCLYEQGELYDTEIENIDSCIEEADKRLSDEIEESEFYGETDQRINNIDTLKTIIGILKYKKDQIK